MTSKCNDCGQRLPEDSPPRIESCREYVEWQQQRIEDGTFISGQISTPESVQMAFDLFLEQCEERRRYREAALSN
jgi:hypothetical protein